MDESEELTGQGVLMDMDENELDSVSYLISPRVEPDGVVTRGGQLTLSDADIPLEASVYMLEAEDGTRYQIELAALGGAGGEPGHMEFSVLR